MASLGAAERRFGPAFSQPHSRPIAHICARSAHGSPLQWHNDTVRLKLDSLVALLPLLSQEILVATDVVTSVGRGGQGGDDGSAGVREPRRPLQPAGAAGVTVAP